MSRFPATTGSPTRRRSRALPTKFEQYVFELEHSTAGTMRDLLAWQYGRANCFEARYEDLRQDTQLRVLAQDHVVPRLPCARTRRSSISRFWQNSLFGGLPRLGNRHVRSGEVAQWKREFTRDLAFAFLTRFPDALQTLGYEMNNAWVSKLQQRKLTRRDRRAEAARCLTFGSVRRSGQAPVGRASSPVAGAHHLHQVVGHGQRCQHAGLGIVRHGPSQPLHLELARVRP